MLISPAHRKRYAQHYKTHEPQVRAPRWLPLVDTLVAELGATSVLDYGCGLEGNLGRHAAYPVYNYDPAVWWWDQCQPADLVVSAHVLEHVEEACLSAVLADMLRQTQKALLLMVSTEPSTKVMHDGTPWHITVHDVVWWGAWLNSELTTMQGAWVWTPLAQVPCLKKKYRDTPKEFGVLVTRTS